MLVLKQSTSIDIRMGPFVDATDGVTPETGITIGAADQAEVLKANGAATVAMTGTLAAVTGCDGWYDYTVQTGDVDTVGEVTFVIQDSSVCFPVFVRGQVVEESIYDALYGASATGFDANGRVDVGEWLGNAVTASSGNPDVNIETIDDGVITAAKLAADCITAAKIATDAIGSDELAATAVSEIWGQVCESNGSRTAQQIMSIVLSAVAGVTSNSGATFSDPSGTNTRITATVNGSNERTAITLTPSS